MLNNSQKMPVDNRDVLVYLSTSQQGHDPIRSQVTLNVCLIFIELLVNYQHVNFLTLNHNKEDVIKKLF